MIHDEGISKEDQLARMLRVNQAGEYGAKRIYAGQLAVLKGTASEPVVRHMQQQEQKHLDYFNEAVSQRHIRPTVLQPLWHVGGWLLGAASAALGEKAAMACTEAVEAVIDEHYQQQSLQLEAWPEEKELRDAIEIFRAEELEHHDTAIDLGAHEAPAYALLSAAVRFHTRCAIWLSQRI